MTCVRGASAAEMTPTAAGALAAALAAAADAEVGEELQLAPDVLLGSSSACRQVCISPGICKLCAADVSSNSFLRPALTNMESNALVSFRSHAHVGHRTLDTQITQQLTTLYVPA